MTFDSLLKDVQAASPKWASYIEARPLADGKSCSYFFFGQMGFKVVMGKKVSRIELDPDYIKDPTAIATTSTVSSNGTLYLNIDLGFNYDEFVKTTKIICEDKKDNATVERFGCCSSSTACSDALHCLHEDDLDYLGCYYRENLEAGRIFYGKNKNISRLGFDVFTAKFTR